MTVRLLVALLASGLAVSCAAAGVSAPFSTSAPPIRPSASPAAAAAATAAPTPASTAAPTPSPSPRPDPPVAADEPAALAAQIEQAERAIRDPRVAGSDLAWFGHLQQVAYRRLSTRPEWRDAVLALVPAALRPAAAANAAATADLRATVNPGSTLPAWTIVEPAPADELLRLYREAEAELGVPWTYLAAIHLVETRMGRIRGLSTAGAQGPMQFMPGTWAAYGEGDVNSNRDAIRAAARYLRANRAPQDLAYALFRYNPSDRYVRAVTAYAETMRADPDAFRGYHGWQVYYLTTRGDVLLKVGYRG